MYSKQPQVGQALRTHSPCVGHRSINCVEIPPIPPTAAGVVPLAVVRLPSCMVSQLSVRCSLTGCSFDDARRGNQLRFPEPLAAGTVKQDRVAISLPDRRQAHRTRAVQAKIHAARGATSHQDLFGKREKSRLLIGPFRRVFRLHNVVLQRDHRAAEFPSACEIRSSLNWDIYGWGMISFVGGEVTAVERGAISRSHATILEPPDPVSSVIRSSRFWLDRVSRRRGSYSTA